MMYRERCPFCGQELLSEFFDDLEAHIMACREALRAEGEALGSFPATLYLLDDLLVVIGCFVERL